MISWEYFLKADRNTADRNLSEQTRSSPQGGDSASSVVDFSIMQKIATITNVFGNDDWGIVHGLDFTLVYLELQV